MRKNSFRFDLIVPTGVLAFLVLTASVFWGSLNNVLSQSKKSIASVTDDEKAEEARLLDILRDPSIDRVSNKRIEALVAIRDLAKLGRLRNNDSVRIIAENLDVNRKAVASGIKDASGLEVIVLHETHLDPPEVLYPAIEALLSSGPDSFPTVLEIIGSCEPKSLHTINALTVLRLGLNNDVEKTVSLIREAAARKSRSDGTRRSTQK